MSLPIFQTSSKDIQLLQTGWSQQLNPVIALPFNSGVILTSIPLVSGDNVINHTLGQKLQGWIVTRMYGAFVQLYDKQNTNQLQDKTLVLNSNGSATINLLVF